MPRFRHVDFSFEIKDPWWIKAEIAGYILSQYDEFWESVIVRGSFRTDLDRAANGGVGARKQVFVAALAIVTAEGA